MKRSLSVLAVLASMLATPSARAEDLAPDEWRVNCTEHSGPQLDPCMIGYVVFPSEISGHWALIKIRKKVNGMLFVELGSTSYCLNRPATLQVDENRTITLPPGVSHIVEGDNAETLVEQFKAGSRALMRIHMGEKCEAQELTIALVGFPAAWKRFEAEGK